MDLPRTPTRPTIHPHFWLALLLTLQLLPQLAIHRAAGFGPDLPGTLADPTQPGTPAGLAYNISDAATYAAWAVQAAQGHLLLRDAYTTDPHQALFLNPYFLLCGLLARITGLMPLTIINILGLLAGPALGLATYAASRAASLTVRAALLATALVLFATGPSSLIILAKAAWPAQHWLPAPGIDASYFDLFPATALLTTPYQSAALAATAAALALCLRALRTQGPSRAPRLLAAALATALVVLIRPYQCAGLAAFLPAAWLATIRDPPTGASTTRRTEAAILAATIGPVILYTGWVAERPVWHQIAQGFRLLHVSYPTILTGYALLWLIAAPGISRALRHRHHALTLLVLWATITALATIAAGPALLKYTDGAPLALASSPPTASNPGSPARRATASRGARPPPCSLWPPSCSPPS